VNLMVQHLKVKKVGNFGWTSNFSFYYAHHLSTIEGGMICTNDETAYEKLRMLRSHGMVREMKNKQMQNSWVKEYDDLNPKHFFIDFALDGCSNYAFNLILKDPNEELMNKIMNNLDDHGVEFRRGSAGGGNQLRQPYLKAILPVNHYKNFPITDHVHFYGMYIGNYPDLKKEDIDFIVDKINS